jgi:hypothetical protein
MVDSRPSGSVLLVHVISPDGKQLAPVLDSPQPVGIKAELCAKSLMNCARIGLLVVETTDDHSLFVPHDKTQNPERTAKSEQDVRLFRQEVGVTSRGSQSVIGSYELIH